MKWQISFLLSTASPRSFFLSIDVVACEVAQIFESCTPTVVVELELHSKLNPLLDLLSPGFLAGAAGSGESTLGELFLSELLFSLLLDVSEKFIGLHEKSGTFGGALDDPCLDDF
ncbi:hypothetical protein KCU74_g56, partial [Aureobasidium melanogenum]